MFPEERQKEKQAHKDLMAWVREYELIVPELRLFFHIPNSGFDIGGKQALIQRQILLAMGVKPGVSDFFWPVPRGQYFGLWMEFKVDGGELSEAQTEWIGQMREQGYCATFAFGREEAKAIICQYHSLGRFTGGLQDQLQKARAG